MTLNQEQIQQLLELAKIALAAVNEAGQGKTNAEMPEQLARLDDYLANGLDEEIWDYLVKEVFIDG